MTCRRRHSLSNGVKQGGILSPKLFNMYVNDLSLKLNNSLIGGSINNKFLNHIFYADDLCLISLSTSAMQQLLYICEEYGQTNDIVFNVNKSMCMAFKPKGVKTDEPSLVLSGNILLFVNQTKYLGVWIECCKTDADTTRQLRKFYAQSNILLRRFSKCSYDVKCMLFRTYCTSLYCCQLWFNSSVTCMKKLRIAYNNYLRRLLYIPRRSSASEMFVNLSIPSFGEFLKKMFWVL